VTYLTIKFCRNVTSNPYHLQCALVRSSFNGSKITLIVTFCALNYVEDSCNPWHNSLLRFLDDTQLETHTPSRILYTSDQLVAEAATYETHNKHQRRTSMPLAGFELAIRAIKRPNTYAVDRTATGIGWHISYMSRVPRTPIDEILPSNTQRPLPWNPPVHAVHHPTAHNAILSRCWNSIYK